MLTVHILLSRQCWTPSSQCIYYYLDSAGLQAHSAYIIISTVLDSKLTVHILLSRQCWTPSPSSQCIYYYLDSAGLQAHSAYIIISTVLDSKLTVHILLSRQCWTPSSRCIYISTVLSVGLQAFSCLLHISLHH